MNEQARAARNAYRRDWAKKNPEKVRAIQERYWTRKAQQLIEAPETAAAAAQQPAEAENESRAEEREERAIL